MELLLCFIATVGFGVIFSVPKRALLLAGLIGVLTWFNYHTLPIFGVNTVMATAISSFFAALVAHLLARKMRLPATTFALPGVIPLLPGGQAYSTMRSFVEGAYIQGLATGVETLLQAGAIAGGLVFVIALFSFGKGIGHRYEPSR
nr:threonine/serine exporter family protein [Texcoconibacillus texcoconensis]